MKDGRCHVVLISSNFWPERTGQSQTTAELAFFIAEQGVPVRVVTAMPFYPEWRIWPEYRGALWRTEHPQGVTVYRSWHFVSPNPSTLTRILHELTLSLLAFPNLIRGLVGARAAFVVIPALSYAFVGTVLAAVLGVRSVLIVNDLQPDAAIELGMMRNRLMIALSRWMARTSYLLANEIYTLSEGMRRRIARDVRHPEKIRLVPVTIDPAELEPIPHSHNEFRRRFVPPGVFAVLHTGNMGQKQDLGILLRAANRLRDDSTVRFYVFGDGATKDAFLKQREALRLDNVEHHPLQDRRLLSHMLSGADLVLVSQHSEVADIVVPSKLITSMGAGAMTVAACSDESEPARLLAQSGGGIVIPAGDDIALVGLIGRLQRGEIDVTTCRNRAREFAIARFGRPAVYGPIAATLG